MLHGQGPKSTLQKFGLRPTRPRVEIYALLINSSPSHFRPKDIYDRLRQKGVPVSLATIYNNLRGFAAVGLVREIMLQGHQIFDSNVEPHHHIVNESTGTIEDTDKVDYLLKDGFDIRSDEELSAVEITVKIRPKHHRRPKPVEPHQYKKVEGKSDRGAHLHLK